jgi:uncharacterized protein (TIGR02611 family)
MFVIQAAFPGVTTCGKGARCAAPPVRMMFSFDTAKRIVFGFTLLALGVAMLVLPGPGWVTIALGLAVLATEYVWARRLLDRIKKTASDVKSRVTSRGSPPGHMS